jgi:EAL domain-containing protein (putative c-di-GMP-specific phosphodiesterase class I)
MDLELVAEGVEDAAMLSDLQELGVELFQGYHFFRPMQPAQLAQERLATVNNP